MAGVFSKERNWALSTSSRRAALRALWNLRTLQKTGGMRIAISRSLKNITAQLIDSSNGCVLATISTQQKAFSGANGGNIEAAKFVGAEIAKKSVELGHKKVTFDRSGYKYHGRVKALAEAARDGGLEF